METRYLISFAQLCSIFRREPSWVQSVLDKAGIRPYSVSVNETDGTRCEWHLGDAIDVIVEHIIEGKICRRADLLALDSPAE